jgi:hypothetical protein
MVMKNVMLGEVNGSSFSPQLVLPLGWEMSGDFHIYVRKMEEVGSLDEELGK